MGACVCVTQCALAPGDANPRDGSGAVCPLSLSASPPRPSICSIICSESHLSAILSRGGEGEKQPSALAANGGAELGPAQRAGSFQERARTPIGCSTNRVTGHFLLYETISRV